MTKIILLMSGGAIGTLLRYLLSELTNKSYSGTFPIGTLMVNLIGSLLIGLLWGFWESGNISANMRVFIFVGVLGGFTTFSAFSLETLNLFRDGEMKMAIINVLMNNVLGILLAFVGFISARGLMDVFK